MKLSILLLFIFAFFPHLSFSQEKNSFLPPETYVPHYKIEIGLNTTTVLIFPAAIREGDKGKSDRDFIMQKQTGLDNVLKIKASRKDFTSSNIHVFTSDGKIYAFDASYTDFPAITTFDLTKLPSNNPSPSLPANPKAVITAQIINDENLDSAVEKIKSDRPFFSKRYHHYQMSIKLQAIETRGTLLFFCFIISNHSNLDYPVDFFRMYLKDEGKVKRSSIQENEIRPFYKDTLSLIPSKSHKKFVVAVQSFTMPDKKQCFAEIYEANGGRILRLSIKNKELLKSKKQ